MFAKPEAKRSRYYVTDNFLRSWLAALANPVSAIAFRPLDELIEEADQRLTDVEGASLEKLTGHLYEERSRKRIGDFPITHRVQGFWDKADTEIDLVAVNETTQTIRFGSCKRSPNVSPVFRRDVQRAAQGRRLSSRRNSGPLDEAGRGIPMDVASDLRSPSASQRGELYPGSIDATSLDSRSRLAT